MRTPSRPTAPRAHAARHARFQATGQPASKPTIEVGEKKARVVQNFLVKSTPEFWQAIDAHIHIIPFHSCAWSEKLWETSSLWLGSSISVDPHMISDVPPPEKEPNVLVNWALPLNAEAHNAIATRVAKDYMRSTAVVVPQKRTQCRKTQARVVSLLCVLACHVLPVSDTSQTLGLHMDQAGY
jgi:hypothetical protein